MIGSAMMGQFLALTPEQKMTRLLTTIDSMQAAMSRGTVVTDENDNETDRITVTHSTLMFGLEDLRTFTRLAFLPAAQADEMVDAAEADEDRDAERLDFYGSIGM
jgi:hypothetical protein